MNALTRSLAGLLALALPASLPAQSDYDLFVKEYSQALKFNNEDGIRKAVQNRPSAAINHFAALLFSSMRVTEQGSDDKADYPGQLAQIKAAFEKAFEIKTLDHVERYYRRTNPELVNQLYKTDGQLTTLHNQWLKCKESGDRDGILAVVESGLQLGRRIEELGHRLKAAEVYANLATIMSSIPKHTTQDTRDTIDYAKMFLSHRDGWEWNKDTLYNQWKNWVKAKDIELKAESEKIAARKKDGLDTSAKGLGGFVDKKITPLSGKLEFRPLRALPAEDACFCGGPVPMNWISVHVAAAPTKIAWFKKRDVYLFRKGGSKIEFALTDREDAEKTPIEAGSKIKPSQVYLEPGKKDPYAFGFFIGSAQEPFAGTVTNVAPSDEAVVLYYRSMSSWVTKLGEHEITFYDDNADGKLFVEDPMDYGFTTRLAGKGPKEEQPVPMYDSIRIGKRGALMPYSSAIKLDEQWWLLSPEDGGKAVQAKALHPDHFLTGTVELKWMGSRALLPKVLIIRGRDQIASTAFNIVAKKPVEVPVGEYEISYGRIEKGKGAQILISHIFKGDSEIIKVEKGKNHVVKLGSPFTFDFVKGGDDTNIEIDSLYFRVKGVGGEVYAKVQGQTPAPEVVVARSADGKGAKVMGTYVPIESAELLTTASETLNKAMTAKNLRGMGNNVAFFPVVKGDKDGSTVLKFQLPFLGGLVGLRQKKKHKLFGSIGPIFK